VIGFVRHGQTAVNRDGRLQGRLDAPLSEVGARQAAALAAALAAEPVVRVVSSPLRRAIDTAAPIAAVHGLDVEVDERLVELDYGEWDGVAVRDIPAADWLRWRDDPAFVPPGGEPLGAVTARVASLLAEVLAAPAGELVVAVSHVSPIKAAVCLALGVDERTTWRMHLGIASVCRVDARPDGSLYLVSFNEQLGSG
jgi:broad specificity phosphatase PhoE